MEELTTATRPEATKFYVCTLLIAIALLVGAWYARSLSFVNDDAFISFRYAKNFADGNGLVFNRGERVEGYTNFLWTIMIAGGIEAGIDPVPLSMTLGILFHLLTIALCAWFAWSIIMSRAGPVQGFGWLAIPIASLALALHRDFDIYATSGLETSMFTFLVLLAYVLLVLAESRRSFVVAGFVFVLVLLTRPDGVVFLGAAFVYIAMLRTNVFRRSLLLLVPLAALYLPYWIWRYTYYGFPFPNTFYAKSVDAASYDNGIEYAWLYFKTYYAIPAGLLLAVVGAWKPCLRALRQLFPRLRRKGFGEESLAVRAFLLAALFVGLWLAFVIHLGGDFMFARFLIPITPIMYLAIGLTLPYFPGKIGVATGALVIIMTFFRFDQYRDTKLVGYVADEWQYYPMARFSQNRSDGLKLRKYFENVPFKLAFGGTMSQFVYYADPALAIESETGLTDTFVAHQPIEYRGRPGHEKPAPESYLIKRKVDFLVWGSHLDPYDASVSKAIFSGFEMPVLLFENEIMDNFRNDSTVEFVDVPLVVGMVIDSLATFSDEDLLTSYDALEKHYFNVNDDSLRKAMIFGEIHNRSLDCIDSTEVEEETEYP